MSRFEEYQILVKRFSEALWLSQGKHSFCIALSAQHRYEQSSEALLRDLLLLLSFSVDRGCLVADSGTLWRRACRPSFELNEVKIHQGLLVALL